MATLLRSRCARLCQSAAVLLTAALVASSFMPATTSAGDARLAQASLPVSKLAVLVDGKWRTWWNSRIAPAQWSRELPAVASAIAWRPSASDGVEWGEMRISGNGEAWRLRVIVARIDPRRVRFGLRRAIRGDSLGGAWTVDSAPRDAVFAVNAGQFSYGRPWGLVVRDGDEEQAPGRGPLSTAIMIDSTGKVAFVPAHDIAAALAPTHPREAFQSYPTLLTGDGTVPHEVRGVIDGIDLAHRDSRLALGQLRDGRLLVALTRFDGLNGALSVVPFGPTVPEMSAIMGALGCRSAVMLDGGISGQMLIRDSSLTLHLWRGWRMVPMALVATARAEQR